MTANIETLAALLDEALRAQPKDLAMREGREGWLGAVARTLAARGVLCVDALTDGQLREMALDFTHEFRGPGTWNVIRLREIVGRAARAAGAP